MVRSCHAFVNLSRLCSVFLSSGPLPTAAWAWEYLRRIKVFKCTHLNYGTWQQASIHTHVRNAVILLWSLLRLAPTNPRRVHETKFCHHKSDLISDLLFLEHMIYTDASEGQSKCTMIDTNKCALTLNVLWPVYYYICYAINPMFHILRGNLVIIHLFIHTYFTLINCLQCTYLWPTKWNPVHPVYEIEIRPEISISMCNCAQK